MLTPWELDRVAQRPAPTAQQTALDLGKAAMTLMMTDLVETQQGPPSRKPWRT